MSRCTHGVSPAKWARNLAAVIDPDRDVQPYIETAAARGLTITHIVETHLHADHTADLITLFGSFRKAGRQGPLYVWGGAGSEPKFGRPRIPGAGH